MADNTLRNFGDVPEDERTVIRLLYTQEQYTLPELARMYSLNYTNFRQAIYHHKWHREKVSFLRDEEVLAKMQKVQGALTLETTVKHLRFLDSVMNTFQTLQRGYDELAERHALHDVIATFPLESYKEFLEVYGKVVKLIAEIKPVSQDLHVYLTQNNQQTNLNVTANKEVLPLEERSAKQALSTILQNLVARHKPPETTEVVVVADTVDPARGQYR